MLLLLSEFIIIRKRFEYQMFRAKSLIKHLPAGRQRLRIDYPGMKGIEHKENLFDLSFGIRTCGREVCKQESWKLSKISNDKEIKIG